MKIDKGQIVSVSIGAILGICSIWGIGALSRSNTASLFSKEAELTMYEKVADDPDGDVYITPKGKKYHTAGCFFLRKSDEVKQASCSSVIEVGYKPCRKCNP
jgi:micrococcal nuclease